MSAANNLYTSLLGCLKQPPALLTSIRGTHYPDPESSTIEKVTDFDLQIDCQDLISPSRVELQHPGNDKWSTLEVNPSRSFDQTLRQWCEATISRFGTGVAETIQCSNKFEHVDEDTFAAGVTKMARRVGYGGHVEVAIRSDNIEAARSVPEDIISASRADCTLIRVSWIFAWESLVEPSFRSKGRTVVRKGQATEVGQTRDRADWRSHLQNAMSEKKQGWVSRNGSIPPRTVGKSVRFENVNDRGGMKLMEV